VINLTLWAPAHVYIHGRNYVQVTRPHIYIHSEQKSWFYGPASQNNVLFLRLKCFFETRLSSESLDPWSAL